MKERRREEAMPRWLVRSSGRMKVAIVRRSDSIALPTVSAADGRNLRRSLPLELPGNLAAARTLAEGINVDSQR